MRIQITGDRDWKDYDIVLKTLASFGPGPHVVVEGEAEGADKISAWAARELGHEVEPHPARWYRIDPKTGKEYFFKGAGPERNIEMLETKRPDIVLAFHNNILRSKGTRHMVTSSIQRGFRTNLVTLNELGEYITINLTLLAEDCRWSKGQRITFGVASKHLELVMSQFTKPL